MCCLHIHWCEVFVLKRLVSEIWKHVLIHMISYCVTGTCGTNPTPMLSFNIFSFTVQCSYHGFRQMMNFLTLVQNNVIYYYKSFRRTNIPHKILSWYHLVTSRGGQLYRMRNFVWLEFWMEIGLVCFMCSNLRSFAFVSAMVYQSSCR